MTDVQRAGRIGGDIFDVDAPPLPHRRPPVIAAFSEDQRQLSQPAVVGEAQVDKAWPGDARLGHLVELAEFGNKQVGERSEEHTSELQSLMRISYAVFCLKKKKQNIKTTHCDHATS